MVSRTSRTVQKASKGRSSTKGTRRAAPKEKTVSSQSIFSAREKEFPSALKIRKTPRNFRKLNSDEVFRACSIAEKEVSARKSKEPHYEIISQARAVRAIDVGLGVVKPGYNIYVAGVQGTGKTSVIRSFLQKSAKKQKTPGDWVYVYNFKNPENPHSFELGTGLAKRFKKSMDSLIDTLAEEVPDALQSEEYENNVNSTVNSSNEKKTKLFSELEKTAKAMNFGVKSTRMGIVTVPIIDGKPLSEKEYGDLSDEQKEKIEAERNTLEPEVLDFARKVRAIEQETKDKLEELRSEIGDYVVSNAMAPLHKEYKSSKTIIGHLKEVKDHIPVIIETNPSYYNLFGKIEKNIEYGIYTTDFKMIKAGALAKANGGYLVLNALDVLRTPQVWETLKRVLKNRLLYIEDLGEQYSILPTSGLRPEPLPLNVKIVLIGSDYIYRMLFQFDEDFNKIFKIKADFDDHMARNERNISDYIDFVTTRTQVESLLPCSSGAIEAIVEYSSRLVDDQDKLTTRFSVIKDLTIEADFIATERKSKKIEREHVEMAIEERYTRSALVEDHMHEMIERGDILISTSSRRIGEVNGLAVYSLGDVAFGLPSRITCRTYQGKPGITNIERDASLSGRIHNKGVSILTSWINATFARKHPVHLAATICFEQNYSGVDGDSATLAELVLILSTIGEIPLDQSIAVTGSVNQFGEVQPVGGINEKVEGFFRVCKMKGLTGRQGAIIPIQNMKHLMLNAQTREAVGKGLFHVWPVSRVEEAFELMTGLESGQWEEEKKRFTPGSAFEAIAKILHSKVSAETKKKEAKSEALKKKSSPVKKSSGAGKKPSSPSKKSSGPSKKPSSPSKKSSGPSKKPSSPSKKSSGPVKKGSRR